MTMDATKLEKENLRLYHEVAELTLRLQHAESRLTMMARTVNQLLSERSDLAAILLTEHKLLLMPGQKLVACNFGEIHA